MKKIFLSMLLGITVLGLGCKKKSSIRPQKTDGNTPAMAMSAEGGVYLSPNGYLVFPTRDVWEATINNLNSMTEEERDGWEKGLGYVSTYGRFYDKSGDSLIDATDNNNSNVGDLLFARLINDKGMVQIENTIYRFVSDSMLLYTLNTQNYNEHYAAFAAGSFNPSFMNRLSGGLEVAPDDTGSFFDYIELHTFGLNMRVLNPFVRTSGPVIGPINTVPGGTISCRAKAEAYYDNYWVYHSVNCKFHYQAKSNGVWVPKKTDVKLNWNGTEQDSKCVIKLKRSSNFSHFGADADLYNHYHDASSLHWMPYDGGRGVSNNGGGEAYATFTYKDVSTGQYETIVTNILSFN